MTFGEKLKRLRLREEYSQEQLAELLHVSRQAVTKWESGAGLPDVENIKSVADLFDVTLDSLLREEEELETSDEGFCWNVSLACAGVGLVIGVLLDRLAGAGAAAIGLCATGGGFIGWAACYIAAQYQQWNKR
ncbi:MAG: helix-turn-helix transcriptional regulator [Eubacteriales bacterium]|nr:helix-turn-helix transcriptional regulator [Eubacteriales bacterium]